jgi:hypothetical protein
MAQLAPHYGTGETNAPRGKTPAPPERRPANGDFAIETL